MKKVLIAALTLLMLLMVVVSSMAETSFTLNVPCQALADDQLYKYHATVYETKHDDTYNMIWVKHRVNETSAVETNRIAAYCLNTGKTSGANWHRADYGRYQCMSNAIYEGLQFSVAGRGNTNYTTKYGLNNITLSGIFYPD